MANCTSVSTAMQHALNSCSPLQLHQEEIVVIACSFSWILNAFGADWADSCACHPGTCNNNPADDCMLPSGQLVESCALMGDHWPIPDIHRPECIPPSAPKPPVPEATYEPCTPDSLCDLLNSRCTVRCLTHLEHQVDCCLVGVWAMGASAHVCQSQQALTHNFLAPCVLTGCSLTATTWSPPITSIKAACLTAATCLTPLWSALAFKATVLPVPKLASASIGGTTPPSAVCPPIPP